MRDQRCADATLGGVGSDAFETAVYSAGLNLYPDAKLALSSRRYPFDASYVSLEYHVQDELGRDELDNDRFITRMTGRF